MVENENGGLDAPGSQNMHGSRTFNTCTGNHRGHTAEGPQVTVRPRQQFQYCDFDLLLHVDLALCVALSHHSGDFVAGRCVVRVRVERLRPLG
eukprot:scaffold43037_cov28-Tisochrysis_lutea.AAC.7